ncbi:cytochrome P450 [Kutzneria albida]|uniref:Cytochrome P450 n=1 Tax=Kutzneria albida DSM 43870 TaxID=1449976 RepID=W5W6F6_9PSEU|nr:cytochrome P450 [Kutzneria albida]AHH96778.1 cytochrome P450 [Kutzneria albida DSM 43870]
MRATALGRGLPGRFDPRAWGQAEIADPYPEYRRYREADPVHFTPEGPSGRWYLFGYEDALAVLTDQHGFGRRASAVHAEDVAATALVPAQCPTLRSLVEDWLVFQDPPRHTRLRSPLVGRLSPRVVLGLREQIREIALDLAAALRGRPVVDLVGEFAAPLPLLVIAQLLGVPGELVAWFRRCALDLQQARGPGAAARAEAAAVELAAYFGSQVRERRGRDAPDLITLLVRGGGQDEPLTEHEIVATCVHLLTAGHETTTNLISKSVLALLRHPEALTALRADPALMPGTVEELIRYDGPVQMVRRWAYRDAVLRGRRIRRGEELMLVLGSANRDPARFPEPDVLRLGRAPGRHLGFGSGIHHCLGAALARVEAEIGLGVLLAEFSRMALAAEPVHYAPDLVFHGPDRLPLELAP